MASVLYLVNNTTQTVLENGTVVPGTVIHRNCQSQATLSGNSINIVGTGYFNVDVSVTLAGSEAGNAVIQLYKDGAAVPGAIGTQTITTASTEYRTISFSAEILRQCACAGMASVTLVNTGIGVTITNVAIRIKRDA
jgi:hypothetical protein